ncbi:ArsR family transcriptional regulator [Candidatus Woesearchaeota archaeon]|jgi:predicted transcriptional regulator|nr:ArsR family transcriptional regulator [Candidatus Woesearchaeota archaeon]MBT4150504.1 ArsR family transcriptional regulator [Candidatus Woesearchaeota archaeon]MBT4247144.1 ArsR family transcriptional regulator [Candidatus Woesearchaeota archaeon]MBT4434630.1 ArsR family transcriptional regulator [Candidatus Woesearchaeota archaeon]MBT7332516.1 ArsR family transcriptional regulator [Candidatus Woesearchaeota archaeon]
MGKITVIKVRHTQSRNVNKELQWLGDSLGLFGNRDKDSSCFRMFIVLVRKSRKNESVSSDDLANNLSLSRATVVHHLKKLLGSGIVIRQDRGYILREANLSALVRDIKRDTNAMLAEIEDVAKEIDDMLG